MKILYFGRKKCKRSKELYFFLKMKTSDIKYYDFDDNNVAKNYIKKFKDSHFDFIITFRSLIIIPDFLLKNASMAINFHPGTPKYRGIGCVNYALYNNESYFGSTAHIIDRKIDNGAIINVKKFKIKKKFNVEEVLELTWDVMLVQAKNILNEAFDNKNYIRKSINNYKGEKWSKKIYSRNQLNSFYKVSLNTSGMNLEKKIRATVTKNYRPYIILHNRKFEFKEDE